MRLNKARCGRDSDIGITWNTKRMADTFHDFVKELLSKNSHDEDECSRQPRNDKPS